MIANNASVEGVAAAATASDTPATQPSVERNTGETVRPILLHQSQSCELHGMDPGPVQQSGAEESDSDEEDEDLFGDGEQCDGLGEPVRIKERRKRGRRSLGW